ncbi:MAG: DUF4852 domain-containing protein [Chitinophagaceae bacterium]|nr:DUF4852 domain-containing protein [Chitinophagaceae bacterium]
MKILLSLFFSLLYFFSHAQSQMTAKEAFFYAMNVNKLAPGDKLSFSPGVGSSGATYQWGDFYASYFDKDNYVKAVHDEFKRVPYLTKYFNEMKEGIKTIDLKKTFYFLVKSPVGTYKTDCGCFPLNSKNFLNYNHRLLDVKEVGNAKLWYDNPFVLMSIGSYFNFSDFDFTLKMNNSEAEKFIDSRKDNNGNINRDVTIKVIYNVTNRYVQSGDRKYFVQIYIHKLEFYNGSVLLGSALPKYNYFDKVNLIKIKNGTEKIFFDVNWKELNQKDSINASYYKITNYKNGKLDKIINYFISGAVETQTEYKYSNDGSEKFGKSVSYYENGLKNYEYETYNDKSFGRYVSWYSNGQKEADIYYTEGKLGGKYITWHSNGYKKEELDYFEGEKMGCDFKWDENGKCQGTTKALQGDYSIYAEYFENGKYIYNSKCPCTDSKKEVQIQTKINLGKTPLLSINEIFGTYNGISEATGTTIQIKSDASVEITINGITYKGGKASIVKTEEKDFDGIQSKVSTKLNKDVEITGSDVSFGSTSQMILLKVGNSMILWSGGDLFYEKK